MDGRSAIFSHFSFLPQRTCRANSSNGASSRPVVDLKHSYRSTMCSSKHICKTMSLKPYFNFNLESSNFGCE